MTNNDKEKAGAWATYFCLDGQAYNVKGIAEKAFIAGRESMREEMKNTINIPLSEIKALEMYNLGIQEGQKHNRAQRIKDARAGIRGYLKKCSIGGRAFWNQSAEEMINEVLAEFEKELDKEVAK